jgi:hypothetical protein
MFELFMCLKLKLLELFLIFNLLKKFKFLIFFFFFVLYIFPWICIIISIFSQEELPS